jgi:hypothetical protein
VPYKFRSDTLQVKIGTDVEPAPFRIVEDLLSIYRFA